MTSLSSTLHPRELTEARGSLTPAVGSAKPSADHRAGRVPAHPLHFLTRSRWGARSTQASRERGWTGPQQTRRPPGGLATPPPAPRRPAPVPLCSSLWPLPGPPLCNLGLSQGKDPPLPPCRPTLRTQSGNSRPMCQFPSTSGAGSFILSCSEPQRCFTQQAQRLPFNRNLKPTPSRTQNRSASRRKPST